LFENVATGVLKVQDVLDIKAGKIVNGGMIELARKIHLDAKVLLENQASGVITAQESLELLCASLIHNAGEIKSLGVVKGETEQVLQDLREGKIVRFQKLGLIGKFAMTTIKTFIKNLQGAAVVNQAMNAQSPSIHNAGKMETVQGGLTLQASILFENVATGILKVQDVLDIKAGKIVNGGMIELARKI